MIVALFGLTTRNSNCKISQSLSFWYLEGSEQLF